MTAQWAPENERSRYVAVVTTGQYLGTALTLVCSPLVKVWWQGIFCAQNRHDPFCSLLASVFALLLPPPVPIHRLAMRFSLTVLLPLLSGTLSHRGRASSRAHQAWR